MTTQCAPCLSDLALVRDAVTTVGGTAVCTAHTVLLRHPSDDPGRRRRRLSELRTLAETRVTDATGLEKERLELLVQEYAVAEAMDLGAPDRTGPGRSERGRRGTERPERGERPPRAEGGPREERPPREDRGPRPPRGERPGRRPEGSTEGAPATESGPATEGSPATEGAPATESLAPVVEGAVAGASSGESPVAAPGPDPVAPSAPETSAPAAESAPSEPAASQAPAQPATEAAPSVVQERPTIPTDAPPAPAPGETTHGDKAGDVTPSEG
jgi:hypothetical protein